jgi:thiosulfate/3-mercaptopyruvate sulfurtransferase
MTEGLFALAGGLEGIERVVRDFYDHVFADVMLGYMFRNSDKERLIAKEVELAARLLGGTHVRYTGKPMRRVHAPHRIMGGQFMRRRKILEDALLAQGAHDSVREAWLGHTDAMRALVTADPGSDCSHIAQTFRKSIAEEVLVTPRWLHENLADVVVVDVRKPTAARGARQEFEAGHIPGAFFVDLETELSAPQGPGRHPLASAETFGALLSRIGAGERTVVAYDADGGSIAARFWWMCRYFGLNTARLLDGGLSSWTGTLETGPGPEPAKAASPSLRPRADMVVDAAGLEALLRLPSTALIDARAGARYRGEHEPIDPVAGHIDGAVSRPWEDNLGQDGRFLRGPALRERFDDYLSADSVVVYCGSGVTACHNLAALAMLGRSDAILYEGSWSDWCTRT